MVKVKNPFVEALKNIAERQDIGSFKKIFDYFGPRLKSFLMKSGADDAVAEEIIQEIYEGTPQYCEDTFYQCLYENDIDTCIEEYQTCQND